MTIKRYVWSEEAGTGGTGGPASEVTYNPSASQLDADNVQTAMDIVAGREVTTTTGVLTLYVRTTGNDSNTGLTIGDALLTPKAAVDKVPKYIRHNVTIDIGEGNFPGFELSGFNVPIGATFTIKGVLGTPTLSSGTTSGTATGGDTHTLIDAGQSWTAHDLRGRLVLVNSQYAYVWDNTSNTIELCYTLSGAPTGQAYSILENKTNLNATCAGGYASAIVLIRGLVTAARDSVLVQSLKITATGKAYGFYMISSDPAYISRILVTGTKGTTGCFAFISLTKQLVVSNIRAENGSYGILFNLLNGTRGSYTTGADGNGISSYNTSLSGIIGNTCLGIMIASAFAQSSSATGIEMYQSELVYLYYMRSENNLDGFWSEYNGYTKTEGFLIQNNTNDGYYAQDTRSVDINSGTIIGNGGYGMKVDECSATNDWAHTLVNAAGVLTISNNTLGGVIANHRSIAILTSCTGTGNGGYGVDVKRGSEVRVTSETTITGSAGDATIDGGTTVLDWSTDFANNNDKVVDITNGSLLRRED